MKKHIPNAITSGNLICGCISIQQMSQGNMTTAAIFILLAAFLDFFDGMAARMLKVSGDLGKQLDSLADMVSFGLAPAFIAFGLLENAVENKIYAYFAFIMAVFSALRLAKFNIDERQSEEFIGLPTPANALFWIGISLSYWQSFNMEHGKSVADLWVKWSANPYFIVGAILLLSYAMVAEIPLISLKFKNFGWKGNEYRYLLIGIGGFFIGSSLFASIPFILLLYLLLSIVKKRRNTQTDEIHS